MSEKRFIVDYEVGVLDTKTNKIICDTVSADEVVDLLNEQQATIEQLERKLELKTEEVEYLKRMMVKWGMVKDE